MNNPILQTEPSTNMKPTYGMIKTIDMIKSFESKGWYMAAQSVARVRQGSRRDGFQKHIIRMRNDAFKSIPGLSADNASVPELCILNAHDGTSAYRLFLGVVRIACLNGLIAGDALASYRVIHSQNAVKGLHDGVDAMVAQLPRMIDQIALLQGTQVLPDQYRAYVKAMYDQRVLPIGGVQHIDYFLPTQRPEDNGRDAYTVFNRVQEMMLRGGIHYTAKRIVRDEAGDEIGSVLRNGTTRRVSNIGAQLKLNQMAYDKAMEILVAA